MSGLRVSDKLSWDDLHLLLVMSENGFVEATATRLGIDPTTVTRRIRRMEKTLGKSLVEQIKGGIVFSEEAQSLIDAASGLDRRLDDIFPKLAEDELQGTVRIACTDYMTFLLADKLAAFNVLHPNLLLDLRESYALDNLEQRKIDIAIRLNAEPNEGLIGRSHYLRFSVYGLKKFKRAKGKGWPWISWNLPHGTLDPWISEQDPKARIVARTTSMWAHSRLAQEGIGVALLPDVLVSSAGWLDDLVKLRDGWDLSLWILTNEELRNVARIRETTKFIYDAIRSLPQ